ncbi:MAG: hypothetical protein RL609_1797 [Bacteroidota bacterium]|jgi:uncharacterized delta-60 repeat protein
MNKKLLTAILPLFFLFIKINAQFTSKWENTINGVGDFGDRFNSVVTDGNNNIYVTGYSVNPNLDRDIIVAKYNSSFKLEWRKTFIGTGNGPDEGKKILVHPNGNIVVMAYVNNKAVGNDFFTAMLKNNGDTIWTRTYNSPTTNLYDEPNAMSIDAQGNIVVVGESDRDPSPIVNNDYLIVKYSSSGSAIFSTRYNATANDNDRAISVVTDPLNNIIVTGRSFNGKDDDYVTIKYNSTGTQQWLKVFNNGGMDRPISIGIDLTGNIYVAGRSNNGNDDDYRLIQYNSAGTQQFSVFYDVAGHDRPVDMVVFPSGGCVITGRCDGNPALGIDYDVHTVSYNSTGSKSWVAIFKGPALNDDIPTNIKYDTNGNTLITGYTDVDKSVSINNDIFIVQYSNTGTELIKQTFNGSGNYNDEGMGVLPLNNGSLIVVGSATNASNQTEAIGLIYKGNSAATMQITYNGIGDNSDNIRGIATDFDGNIYFCGYTVNKDQSRDFTYGKLNPNGTMLWKKDTTGTLFGSDEEANSIAIDSNGNLIVSGYLKNSGTSSDVYVEKTSPTGSRIWNFLYDSPINESDRATDVVVNKLGEVFIIGKSDVDPSWQVNDDILVIKISSTGTMLWKRNFSSPTLLDRAQFAKLNSSGELIVAGQLQNGKNDNLIVLKYNSIGTLMWSKTLDISGGNDKINDMVTDKFGNIILTGQSQKSTLSIDYESFTICLDNLGQQTWAKFIGFTGNGQDEGISVALDNDNSIWVAGNIDSDTTADVNLNVFLMHYDITGKNLLSAPILYQGQYSDEVDDLEIIENGVPVIAVHSNTLNNGKIDFAMNLVELKNGELTNSYQRTISDTIDVANTLKWHSPSSSLIVGGSSYTQNGQRDMLIGKYTRGMNADNKAESETLGFYPNPCEDYLIVTSKSTGILKIMSVNGDILYNQSLPADRTNLSIDLSTLSSGFYILEITSNQTIQSSLFIKK